MDTVSYEEYDVYEEVEDAVIIHYFLGKCNMTKILEMFRLDLMQHQVRTDTVASRSHAPRNSSSTLRPHLWGHMINACFLDNLTPSITLPMTRSIRCSYQMKGGSLTRL